MPAVGADGRNVMKLIPVQKVNGQFVQSQTSMNKKDIAEPQTAFTMNLAAASTSKDNMLTLEPSANLQFVKKRLSYLNGLFTPVNVTGRYPEISGLLNTSMQTQDPTVTSKETQSTVPMTSPVLNFGKSSTLLITKQLPVTVKSPVLPNGQYLQIPANAQVKTLPASALPLAIKKQIFTSATNSSSNSNLPTVVYVSPVTTMKQGGTQICPKLSTVALNHFPILSDQTLSASSLVSSTQGLKSIDKVGQRPVSPIRWVIEEQDGSPDSHPCIVPVKSSSMTADILKTLAEMEKANKACENKCEKPSPPQLSQTKTGKDNALVMCNGKVYFVAKKTPELCNRPSKPLEASRNMICSSTQARDSGGLSQSSSSLRPHIVIPDEIIDLCDDDPQDDLTRQPISQYVADEDEDSNVIFVSYIPPKPVSNSEQNIETAPVNDLEGEQKMVKSQNNVKGQVVGSQDIGTSQDMAGCQVGATSQESKISQESITGQGRETSKSNTTSLGIEERHGNATGMEIENIQGNATNQEMDNSQYYATTQETKNFQGDITYQEIESSQHNATTQKIENIHGNACLQTDMGTQEQGSADPIPDHKTSMFDQTSQQTCDQLQKHMFGITSDVRICLERIDATKLEEARPKEFPQFGTVAKRTFDGIRKLIQRSKIEIKKGEHKETQVSPKRNNDVCLKDAKRQKIENIQTAPEDSENTGKSLISPSPQLEMLYDAEAEQIFGYEDLTDNDLIPTTDEKEIPAIPLSDLDPAHIFTQSSNSSAPSVQPHANTEIMDCVLEAACSAGSKNRKPKPGRRRGKGKGKRCMTCPDGVTGTQGKAIRSSSIAQEEPGFTTPPDSWLCLSSKQNKQRSIKSQRKDKEPTSVEIQCPSTMREQGSSTPGEILANDPFIAPMDPEEIKRHERIKRLKELLKEKETALEMIRKNMG